MGNSLKDDTKEIFVSFKNNVVGIKEKIFTNKNYSVIMLMYFAMLAIEETIFLIMAIKSYNITIKILLLFALIVCLAIMALIVEELLKMNNDE